MPPVLSRIPEVGAKLRGDFAWLAEVLACPSCRHRSPGQTYGEVRCQHIDNHFSVCNGIVYPADEQESLWLGEQRKVWETLEKARGSYDLPAEKLLRLPEDPDTRALLDWLRALLREKAPLRILQLAAGRGWAARALAEDSHQVVASDALDDPHISLGCAVRLRAQTGLGFACVRTNPTALPFRPGAFDCVFCFDTLRQTSDLERVFREISRVLRPGGLFLALQEPFRGALTTQTQRLVDTPFYRLARGWLPGKLPPTADPGLVELRSQLGATLHEARRRVPFCLAVGEAAGMQTTVLPTAVALSLSSDLSGILKRPEPDAPARGWNASLAGASGSGLFGLSLTPAAMEGKQPAWLDALARAYRLDIDRLRAEIELARETLGYDLIPELLNHWILVGNIDGVLLARKNDHELHPLALSQSMDSECCRRLEPMLLACASEGFLPIYGVHAMQREGQERYCWIQPQAGLIVPASDPLEVTVRCPAKPFCDRPVRMEFRLENERLPIAVVLVSAGKKVTLKLPITPSVGRRASLFVGITVNFGFLPSDFNAGPGCDTRLLAFQLHSIRAKQAPASDPGTLLRQIASS